MWKMITEQEGRMIFFGHKIVAVLPFVDCVFIIEVNKSRK